MMSMPQTVFKISDMSLWAPLEPTLHDEHDNILCGPLALVLTHEHEHISPFPYYKHSIL